MNLFKKTRLTGLNIFFDYDSQKLTIFLKYDQRIGLFLEYDAKNWTLYFLNLTQRINWTIFSNMTKRIEPFFSNMTQSNDLFFFEYDSQNWFFFEYDSQNWTFFVPFLWIWPKNWTPFFLNMTHRIEPFNFWKWLTELNLLFSWLKALNLFLNDSKNWTYFWMTQRIELIFEWLKELNFLKWLKELNFFQFRLTEMNPFFFEYDQRIGLFILEFDAKNWTFCFLSMTQRIEPLNYLNTTQRVQLFFFEYEFNLFFWIWRKELNSFSWVWRKDLDPFQIWRKELDPFSNLKERNVFFFEIWLKEFFCMSPRMEIFFVRVKELNFFEYDSWNWTLLFEYDSKNWTYFQYDSKYWFFQTKILTQRIQPLLFFEHDSKNSTFFFQMWLKKLNFFFECYSKNWTLFSKTPRIEPFFNTTQRFCLWKWLKQIKNFEYDSKNWTSFWMWFKNFSQRL